MSGEERMWESDPCEAYHTHPRVKVLQNALCKEDQPNRNPNQQGAAWNSAGSEEILNDSAHHWGTRRTHAISYYRTCFVGCYAALVLSLIQGSDLTCVHISAIIETC